jgi:hypothetical protein
MLAATEARQKLARAGSKDLFANVAPVTAADLRMFVLGLPVLAEAAQPATTPASSPVPADGPAIQIIRIKYDPNLNCNLNPSAAECDL